MRCNLWVGGKKGFRVQGKIACLYTDERITTTMFERTQPMKRRKVFLQVSLEGWPFVLPLCVHHAYIRSAEHTIVVSWELWLSETTDVAQRRTLSRTSLTNAGEPKCRESLRVFSQLSRRSARWLGNVHKSYQEKGDAVNKFHFFYTHTNLPEDWIIKSQVKQFLGLDPNTLFWEDRILNNKTLSNLDNKRDL